MPRVAVAPLRPHRGWLAPLLMVLVVAVGRPICLGVQLLLRWWRWGRRPPNGAWRPLFPRTLPQRSGPQHDAHHVSD